MTDQCPQTKWGFVCSQRQFMLEGGDTTSSLIRFIPCLALIESLDYENDAAVSRRHCPSDFLSIQGVFPACCLPPVPTSGWDGHRPL